MRTFDFAVIQRNVQVAVVVITAVGLDIGFQNWEACTDILPECRCFASSTPTPFNQVGRMPSRE